MKPIESRSNGRNILLILSIGYVAIFHFIQQQWNGEIPWKVMGIPTHHPSFIDLRGVLTGYDAARLGFDPLYENPLDPYQRPVVYPRLWLTLEPTGLSETHTVPLAYFIFIIYAVSIFLAMDNYDGGTAAGLALVIFSPAAMMCYKFANLELLIFSLIALALWLEKSPLPWTAGLLLFASLLKYFPIVSFGYLIKSGRERFFRVLCAVGVLFLAYIGLTWRDASWILGHTPKGSLTNYGAGVVSFRLFELTNSRDLYDLTILLLFLFLYVLSIVILYLSASNDGLPMETDHAFLDSFRMGTVIYLATFAQGNSFNYRLIFLIFTIPQLVCWARSHARVRLPAGITLVLVVLSSWGMAWMQLFPADFGFAADELVNWGLFAGFLYLFLISSPPWVRAEIRTFADRYRKKPRNSTM